LVPALIGRGDIVGPLSVDVYALQIIELMCREMSHA